jgi:hypothetical protein
LRFKTIWVPSRRISYSDIFILDYLDHLTSAKVFVHLATVCYVLGLLTRRELLLRFFLMSGSGFYILYYYFIADAPLWEAISASILIGMSSLPVVYRIFRERSTFGMSEDMLTLYRSFPTFNPGQFRKMMRKAEIIKVSELKPLLEQGVMPTHLFLTITDGFILQRDSLNAELGPGNFLGEISFLLGGPATATVTAKTGSSYVAWDLGELHYMMEKSPTMSNAISVLLNKDVARKLAVSFPSQAPSMVPTNLT